MRRTAIRIGLVGGALLSLASLYPLIGLFAPLALPQWQPPVSSLLHGLLLMGSAVLGVPVLLAGGAFAARRAAVRGWLDGLRVGALAGATAGMGLYLTVISPLNGLVAFGLVTPHLPHLMAANPLPLDTLLDYVAAFDRFAFSIELTLFGMAALWGLQGALLGWSARSVPRGPSPTLFGLVTSGRNPREWFAHEESTIRAALIVGVGIGILALVTTFGWFYAGAAQELPEFETILQGSRTGMITGSLPQMLTVLSPVLGVLFFVYGFLIVAFARQPRTRYRDRIQAVTLAGVIIVSFLMAVALRIFYFNVGLAPFMVGNLLRQGPDITDTLVQLQPVMDSFAVPAMLVSATIVIAWVTVGLTILLGAGSGLIQGGLSAWIVPLFVKRPVDRAAALVSELRDDPNSVLPRLYVLCEDEADAFDALAHLAVRAYDRMPDVSLLAAAYHTLATSDNSADRITTAGAIQDVLQRHPEWRWSTDFAAAYGTLHEVLAAQTLEQILDVPPPRTQETGSLPGLMALSLQHLNRILTELQKTKKVEGLQPQLIFLENGLAAIHDAQRFVTVEMRPHSDTAVVMPQRAALLAALDHWQGVVLTAIKRLKGRADIVSTLQSQMCAYCNPMPLVLQVANRGLNVAQEVRLRLLPGTDYTLDESEAEIEILPPGEVRDVTMTVIPEKETRRLRIEWEILYDDAVVDDRRVLFGDVVEFAVEERPFERVFPIPYVTGTPLKTDDVFVGREDVFAFIRENLLGAHQNNVIILHGQRRTGKTSVLYRLGQVMSETHYGVLIDMQGKPARGEADFLHAVADDIAFTLEDAGIELEIPSREAFEAAPEFAFRSRFLRDLLPRLNGKNLLLMFDEFEELQRRVENGRLQPEIFQFLRNLMQHETAVDFVFSGTHRLETLSATYWSVLFNIAAYKPITFLGPDEVRRLMTEPIAQYNIEYDPLAAERIIKVTAGHPYFTQLVLHELMVFHNETQRSYLTVSDVNQVLERILERGGAHFKYIWAESTPGERELLRTAAELLHGGKRGVDANDLRAQLLAHGRASDDDWHAALTSLDSRDILTRRNARGHLYSFKVDLVRLWIDRTQPAL